MLELYVVRHGETVWNVERRMQGRLDSPLTSEGIRQAKRLRERLAHLSFEAVITSPSGRAQQTAELISATANRYDIDQRLMEIHLGEWQGLTEQEIIRTSPHSYQNYYQHPEQFFNRDGESYGDVRRRLEGWLLEVERAYSSGKILVVTHGVVTKTLLQLSKKEPIMDFWKSEMVQGASLSLIHSHQGSRTVVMEGCCKHHLSVKGAP